MNLNTFTHVYNRGVDKRQIFLTQDHHRRFLLTLRLSRLKNAPPPSVLDRLIKEGKIKPNQIENAESEFGPPFIDILAFCLMWNHYHLLLGEENEDRTAIVKFMQRVGTAYTMYFNKLEKRKGRLFESQYKSVHIEHDEQLLQTERYIHVNPTNSGFTKLNFKSLPDYPWSSLTTYLRPNGLPWINTQPILSFFENKDEFMDHIMEGSGLDRTALLDKDLRLE